MDITVDYKENRAPKNWCFWTVVLEGTLESPLDCKEIQPVNPKGYQSWMFIEGLMLKLKLQYFGHLMWKTDSLEKTLMLGKIESRRRRGRQRMRRSDGINWLDGHEFEQAPGVGDGQGSLECCNPWGCKVRHDWATELNWTEQTDINQPEQRNPRLWNCNPGFRTLLNLKKLWGGIVTLLY